jgi:hypothetical protein
MSVIGEKFKKYVQSQIAVRQRTHGKGYAPNSFRTNAEIEVLNNQNAWLKLSSSVRIVGNEAASGSSSTDSVPISAGVQRLTDIGLTNTYNFTGNKLARQAVLFNTLSEVVPTTYSKGKVANAGTHNFRSGVALRGNVWNMNSYGLGGTSFGLSPAPGLISAKIDCKNRGSIRSATVEIKCYNKFQFELLELLYLRLGYSMLLEWGWDKYINGGSQLSQVGNTLCEDVWFQDLPTNTFRSVIDTIEKYRQKYDGNYDGFLGKVTNFNWKFGADGTFDITLNLITIGDVIESLKVNLPQKMKSVADIQQISQNSPYTTNLLDTSIVQNAGSSTLAYRLYSDIVETDQAKWTGGGNYLGLFTLLKQTEESLVSDIQAGVGKEGKGVNIDKYNYFLTFGQLLNYITEYVIPSVQNNKMIKIDTNSTENICSIFPMQVSLDPRICFIKPFYLAELSANTTSETAGKTTYVKNWYGWQTQNQALDFGITDTKGVMYGQIMNVYLNYNFVSDCLKDTTSNDEVFLFKFLSKICSGINSSLGGLTQLEPILEDDNILKIIDQNPIPGIANSATFGNRFKGQITPFEIFGYNTANIANSGSVISNFVRDFGFVTKIDPSLASMITIGATKEGTKSKNYDGTAFSKWNEGLEDAYAMKYDDPNSYVETNIEDSKGLYAPLTNENINAMETYFNSLPESNDGPFWFDPEGYKEYSEAGGKKLYSTREIVKCPVTGEDFGVSTWKEYFADVMEFFLSQQKEEPKKEEIATNYIQWLAVAFQGAINGVAYTDPNYFQLSEDFISLGKQLWKSYKTAYDNLEYELNKNPSNVIGFIPIDANIKIDGLSGIRIYQELTVQQGVLPPAYPKAVKFLITKVNHEISDNDWSTSLSTISTPVTKESKIPLNNIVADIIINNPDLGSAEQVTRSKNAQTAYDLAEKRSPGFKEKTRQVAAAVGTTEDALVMVMYKESGINPGIRNSIGCVGLIQFCPDVGGGSTKRIGKTVYTLKNVQGLSGVAQLDVVLAYLKALGFNSTKKASAGDLYGAIFYPVSANKPKNWVYGSEQSKAYAQKVARQNPAIAKFSTVFIDGKKVIDKNAFDRYVAS